MFVCVCVSVCLCVFVSVYDEGHSFIGYPFFFVLRRVGTPDRCWGWKENARHSKGLVLSANVARQGTYSIPLESRLVLSQISFLNGDLL